MPSWSPDAGNNREFVGFDELKARYDLRELIVPHLEKARPISGGEYFVACCPFHDDSKPSFIVRRESYCCLSSNCGTWGDVEDWFAYQHPGYNRGELLKLIANDIPRISHLPAKKQRQEPEVEPLPEPMNLDVLKDFSVTPELVGFCYDKWLLSEQTIRHEGIRHDEQHSAVVIPVWGDSQADLITLRFRLLHRKRKRYWGVEGRNNVYGYGRRWIKGAQHAVVVFGEMTALFLNQWGIASFSWTNGCSSFRPYLKGLLSHLHGGVVVPDVDEEEKAMAVAITLGKGWKVAFLDEVWDGEGDVIDWIKDSKGDFDKFCQLLNSARMPENGVRRYAAALYGEQEWTR